MFIDMVLGVNCEWTGDSLHLIKPGDENLDLLSLSIVGPNI